MRRKLTDLEQRIADDLLGLMIHLMNNGWAVKLVQTERDRNGNPRLEVVSTTGGEPVTLSAWQQDHADGPPMRMRAVFGEFDVSIPYHPGDGVATVAPLGRMILTRINALLADWNKLAETQGWASTSADPS